MTDEWMKVVVIAPHDVGRDVIRFLERCHHYKEVDWCVLARTGVDASRVDFGPCNPLTFNGYDLPTGEDHVDGEQDHEPGGDDGDQEGPGRRPVP